MRSSQMDAPGTPAATAATPSEAGAAVATPAPGIDSRRALRTAPNEEL